MPVTRAWTSALSATRAIAVGTVCTQRCSRMLHLAPIAPSTCRQTGR